MRIAVYFLLLAFLISCKGNITDTDCDFSSGTDKLGLKLKRQGVKLLLDSAASHDFWTRNIISSGDTNYLVTLDKGVIRYYNLNDLCLEKRIEIPHDGPNGMQHANVNSFFCLNKTDNILVANYENAIYFFRDDSLLRRYAINERQLCVNEHVYTVECFYSVAISCFNAHLYNNGILLRTYININNADPDYYNFPNLAVYDFQKDSITCWFGDFPKYLAEDYYGMYDLKQVISVDSLTIVGYANTNKHYVYNNSNGLLLYEKCIKSRYIGDFQRSGLVGEDEASQNMSNYQITSPAYQGIFLDKVKKRVYRIAKHNQALYGSDGKLSVCSDFSIIIADIALNVLGEVFFDNDKAHYEWSTPIVINNEVWLHTPDKDTENEIFYDVYETVEI